MRPAETRAGGGARRRRYPRSQRQRARARDAAGHRHWQRAGS